MQTQAKSSPEQVQQYLQFFRDATPVCTKYLRLKLAYNNIVVKQKPHYELHYAQIVSIERAAAVITYAVSIGIYVVHIKLINIDECRQKNVRPRMLSVGAFGQVFSIKNKGEPLVAKRIKIASRQTRTMNIERNQGIFLEDGSEDLATVLREYAIAKICSALEIGPQMGCPFGFDIFYFDKHIEFYMEKCEVLEWRADQLLSRQGLLEFTDRLKSCVYTLHLMNMVHMDLKPGNILYSNRLQKYVLCDFGISSYVVERLGEKSLTCFIGTYAFMSEEMKVLQEEQQGYVDLYFNDMCCLKNTFDNLNIRSSFVKTTQLTTGIYVGFDLLMDNIFSIYSGKPYVKMTPHQHLSSLQKYFPELHQAEQTTCSINMEFLLGCAINQDELIFYLKKYKNQDKRAADILGSLATASGTLDFGRTQNQTISILKKNIKTLLSKEQRSEKQNMVLTASILKLFYCTFWDEHCINLLVLLDTVDTKPFTKLSKSVGTAKLCYQIYHVNCQILQENQLQLLSTIHSQSLASFVCFVIVCQGSQPDKFQELFTIILHNYEQNDRFLEMIPVISAKLEHVVGPQEVIKRLGQQVSFIDASQQLQAFNMVVFTKLLLLYKIDKCAAYKECRNVYRQHRPNLCEWLYIFLIDISKEVDQLQQCLLLSLEYVRYVYLKKGEGLLYWSAILKLAHALLNCQQIPEALHLYNLSAYKYSCLNNAHQLHMAQAYSGCAECLYKSNRHHEASAMIQRSMQLLLNSTGHLIKAEKVANSILIRYMIINNGELYRAANAKEQSSIVDSMREAAKQHTAKGYDITIQNRVAIACMLLKYYISRQEYQLAEQQIQHAKEYLKIPNEKSILVLLSLIGVYYASTRQPQRALQVVDQINQYPYLVSIDSAMAHCKNTELKSVGITEIYTILRMPQQAEHEYQRLVSIQRSTKSSQHSSLHRYVGSVFEHHSYYNLAIQAYMLHYQTTQQVQVMADIGQSLLREGKPKQAVPFLKLAYIYHTTQDQRFKIRCIACLAEACQANRRSAYAQQLNQQIIEAGLRSKDIEVITQAASSAMLSGCQSYARLQRKSCFMQLYHKQVNMQRFLCCTRNLSHLNHNMQSQRCLIWLRRIGYVQKLDDKSKYFYSYCLASSALRRQYNQLKAYLKITNQQVKRLVDNQVWSLAKQNLSSSQIQKKSHETVLQVLQKKQNRTKMLQKQKAI